MTLTRSVFADALEMAPEAGPYGFWPVTPPDRDPQLLVSLNDRSQPFHLVYEHDAVLVNFTGHGTISFPEGPVRWHPLNPADHVYLPAGLPYRVIVDEPCVQFLYKADVAALEAVAFYCESCGGLIDRVDFDPGEEPLQRHYHRLCTSFNDDEERRRCPDCRTVAPEIDLDPYAWLELANALTSTGETNE